MTVTFNFCHKSYPNNDSVPCYNDSVPCQELKCNRSQIQVTVSPYSPEVGHREWKMGQKRSRMYAFLFPSGEEVHKYQ